MLNFKSSPEQQSLEAFSELRKATISFVMSVCLSVCFSDYPHFLFENRAVLRQLS